MGVHKSQKDHKRDCERKYKPDIVLVPEQRPLPATGHEAVSYEPLPMLNRECKYVFGGGLYGEGVYLQTLKSHRQLQIKIKEIGPGITISFVIRRNGVVLETFLVSGEKDSLIEFDLLKDDIILFLYSYPSDLLPPPKVDFTVSLVKKH